jgi:NADH-quinone oxidoreductase subunit L
MLVPLLLLAVGAVLTGYLFYDFFVGEHERAFWAGSILNAAHNHVLHDMHEVPAWVPLAPTVVAVLGIALAYLLYMVAPGVPARLAAAAPAVYRFLLNKWYFDELYDLIFVRPAQRLARLFWQVGDVRIIDGMPNGAADLAAGAARGAVRIQTGRVANYAFAMIIGLVFFVTLFMFGLR